MPAGGGWNQRIPPGVARCTCEVRRLRWAQLSPDAGNPCCGRSCCQAAHAAVVCTRDEVLALRSQAQGQRWTCPRCGEPVWKHTRNFDCVDQSVKALRAKKQASYHRAP